MGPDASASNVAASATANHPRNKLQHHANASKAAACATVNHHQNTPQNQTKTQRHTTHENCLTLLSEALKEEVITLPRQRPDCIWRRWVQMHLIQCSRFRNGEPPSEHAPRHHRQKRNDQTASTRRLGPNDAFCIPKSSRYYTANGEPPSEQASGHHANASKAAACATVNHHQNTPQNQTKTQRHTTHENCLTLLSEALKEEVITLPRQRPDCIWRRWVQMHLIQCSRFRNGEPPSEHAPRHHRQKRNDQTASTRRLGPNDAFCIPKSSRYYTANGEPPSEQASGHHANASKATACATVNHHQNTPQNQTKTQRHTTHENCLTLLSEALKEEVITLPRQRPDCIWRRWVQMHLIQCSRFRNGEPPSEHAPRHHRQKRNDTALHLEKTGS